MRRFVALAFVAVGLLNLYPAVGVLGVAQLESLYGVPVASAELELLLRHRAVAIGLVGALLLAAAWHAPLRPAALLAGVVSMGAYLVLAWPVDAHAPPIARVFWADVVGLAVLLAAGIASYRIAACNRTPE